MRRFFPFTSLLLGGLCAASVQAAPEPFACPAELPHPEETLSEVPAGFKTMTMVPHPVLSLSEFRVNLGHPAVAAPQARDKMATTRDGKGVTTQTLSWNVSTLRDAYAVCIYRATPQTLIRSLAGYRECSVKSSAFGDGMLRMEGASCK